MNKYHFLSFICFFVGIGFFVIGFLSGDVDAGFIVIIPFISGSGIYALLGFIFIFLSFILFMFGFTHQIEYSDNMVDDENIQAKKTSIKTGGVVLIGPIPIVFGSNWKIAAVLMVLAIVMMIVSYFLFLK